MPVTAEEMTRAQNIPMKEVLEKQGITKERLAKELLAELEATITKVVKVKGFMLPETSPDGALSASDLPEGYRKVVKSPDETLIERDLINWETRQRARMDAQKLLGAYPAAEYKFSHEVSGLVKEVIEDLGAESDVKLPSQEPDE